MSIVNGQKTDNRRGRTKVDHKSSPCHYVTGELIRKNPNQATMPIFSLNIQKTIW